MKNLLIILTSFGLGYALNTDTGKKLRTWTLGKVQNQVQNLIGDIDKVAEDSPVPEGEKK